MGDGRLDRHRPATGQRGPLSTRLWVHGVLTLGCFFGWLLSFPLAGPLLRAVPGEVPAAGAVLAFTAGHAAGLVLAGRVLRPGWRLRVGAVGCGLLTGVLSFGLPVWWPGVFGLLGLLAGPLPVA